MVMKPKCYSEKIERQLGRDAVGRDLGPAGGAGSGRSLQWEQGGDDPDCATEP